VIERSPSRGSLLGAWGSHLCLQLELVLLLLMLLLLLSSGWRGVGVSGD
jgi:hypothetical protein